MQSMSEYGPLPARRNHPSRDVHIEPCTRCAKKRVVQAHRIGPQTGEMSVVAQEDTVSILVKQRKEKRNTNTDTPQCVSPPPLRRRTPWVEEWTQTSYRKAYKKMRAEANMTKIRDAQETTTCCPRLSRSLALEPHRPAAWVLLDWGNLFGFEFLPSRPVS